MRVIGVAFAVSLVFAPFVAAGQPAGHRLPRIGYLSGGSDSPRDAAFRQGLRELGYIEGRTSPSSTGSQRESSNGYRALPSSLCVSASTSSCRLRRRQIEPHDKPLEPFQSSQRLLPRIRGRGQSQAWPVRVET